MHEWYSLIIYILWQVKSAPLFHIDNEDCLCKNPAGLEGYVRKEEKRLTDAIQFKIAADYELSREIHLFEKFKTAVTVDEDSA